MPKILFIKKNNVQKASSHNTDIQCVQGACILQYMFSPRPITVSFSPPFHIFHRSIDIKVLYCVVSSTERWVFNTLAYMNICNVSLSTYDFLEDTCMASHKVCLHLIPVKTATARAPEISDTA